MTELEGLLLKRLDEMEQRHQRERQGLRAQLDEQQRYLVSLQQLLQDGLSGYESHCSTLQGAFERLERNCQRELTSQGQSLARTQKAMSEALGSLNSSVDTVKNSLETLRISLAE